MVRLSTEQVLDLIGLIYDCAIDPGAWPAALEAISKQFNFINGSVTLQAIPSGKILLNHMIGVEPRFLAAMGDFAHDIIPTWGGFERIQNYPLDEPIVHSKIPGLPPLVNTRYYTEWLQPQGIFDAIAIGFARDNAMIGTIGLGRHISSGPITEEEVSAVRLIAPHFRRAAVISKLLDIQTIAAQTFETMLNGFSSGIVFLDDQVRVVHANTAAGSMLSNASPIAVREGRLTTMDTASTSHLQALITQASLDERQLGHRGIGVPVHGRDGTPCVIHVLPLGAGDIRPGLKRDAKVALFITTPTTSQQVPRDAIGLLYDLTPAEARVFELVASGMVVQQVAETLGVAKSTVKTHLLKVFEKTGCHRQTDLVSLALSLSSPT